MKQDLCAAAAADDEVLATERGGLDAVLAGVGTADADPVALEGVLVPDLAYLVLYPIGFALEEAAETANLHADMEVSSLVAVRILGVGLGSLEDSFLAVDSLVDNLLSLRILEADVLVVLDRQVAEPRTGRASSLDCYRVGSQHCVQRLSLLLDRCWSSAFPRCLDILLPEVVREISILFKSKELIQDTILTRATFSNRLSSSTSTLSDLILGILREFLRLIPERSQAHQRLAPLFAHCRRKFFSTLSDKLTCALAGLHPHARGWWTVRRVLLLGRV